MSNHQPPPGFSGFMVSLGSGLYTFFGGSLPIVQWFAAAVCIIAGIASVASAIKHWHHKPYE